jgi:multidrug efflux pump
MISATILAIFFVPLFFVVVEKIFKPKHPGHDAAVAEHGGEVPASEAHQ